MSKNIYVKLQDPSTIYRNTDTPGQHVYIKTNHVVEVPYDLVKAPIAAGVLIETDKADYEAFKKAQAEKVQETEQKKVDDLDANLEKAEEAYLAAKKAKQDAKDAEEQAKKDEQKKVEIKELRTKVTTLSKEIADEKDAAKLKKLEGDLAKAKEDLETALK